MSLAALSAAVAIIALAAGAGRFLVGFVGSDLSLPETLGWSWGAGTLMLASVYTVLMAVGAQPGPKKLGLVLAIAALAGILRRSRRARGLPRQRDPIVAVLAAIAAAGCVVYLLQAVAEPLWSTDFLAIWGLKGKTIYFTGSIPDRLFHDPATYWSHPEYPLFVPLMMAGFSAATGSWNDETLALLFAAWQIATVFAVAGYCRRRGSARAGAAAAALVAWFHPLYRGSSAGLADVPFAFAAVLLFAAAADRRPERAAIAALLVVWTKQEGTVLALLVAAALWVGSREDRRARRAIAAVVAAIAAAHFFLLWALRGPVADRDFTLAPLARAADLAVRFGHLIRAVEGSLTVALVVGIAGCVLIFFVGKRSREDLLLGALGLQVAAYLAACVLSAFDPVWQFESAFYRTAGALVPTAALLLGSRLPANAMGPPRETP